MKRLIGELNMTISLQSFSKFIFIEFEIKDTTESNTSASYPGLFMLTKRTITLEARRFKFHISIFSQSPLDREVIMPRQHPL